MSSFSSRIVSLGRCNAAKKSSARSWILTNIYTYIKSNQQHFKFQVFLDDGVLLANWSATISELNSDATPISPFRSALSVTSPSLLCSKVTLPDLSLMAGGSGGTESDGLEFGGVRVAKSSTRIREGSPMTRNCESSSITSMGV